MSNPGSVGNWVGETTTTIGVGDIALGGALAGFTTFASIGESLFWYGIADGDDREAGLGTLSGNTLARTTVYSTLVNGIYADNNPAPIALTGLAQVFSTFNKTAFDILDDGIDTSEAHITDSDIHISEAGASDDEIPVWSISTGGWVPSGFSISASLQAGNLLNQTLRWDDSAWVPNTDIIADGAGNVNIVNGHTNLNTVNTLGKAGIGTATPHASSMIDINGLIYTENLPLVDGAKRFVVIDILPGTPDPDTLYFLTGP